MVPRVRDGILYGSKPPHHLRAGVSDTAPGPRCAVSCYATLGPGSNPPPAPSLLLFLLPLLSPPLLMPGSLEKGPRLFFTLCPGPAPLPPLL
jgi:hypothetical protein